MNHTVKMAAAKIATHRITIHRLTEDALAWGGMVLAALYVIGVEVFPSVRAALGYDVGAHAHGFPWGVITVVIVMVAPKTIGKAAAAGVLGKVTSRT